MHKNGKWFFESAKTHLKPFNLLCWLWLWQIRLILNNITRITNSFLSYIFTFSRNTPFKLGYNNLHHCIHNVCISMYWILYTNQYRNHFTLSHQNRNCAFTRIIIRTLLIKHKNTHSLRSTPFRLLYYSTPHTYSLSRPNGVERTEYNYILSET